MFSSIWSGVIHCGLFACGVLIAAAVAQLAAYFSSDHGPMPFFVILIAGGVAIWFAIPELIVINLWRMILYLKVPIFSGYTIVTALILIFVGMQWVSLRNARLRK